MKKSCSSSSRFAPNILQLNAEELKLVRMAKSQFERRGGYVRIFPTADSWNKYAAYLGFPPALLKSMYPYKKASFCRSCLGYSHSRLCFEHLQPGSAAQFQPHPSHATIPRRTSHLPKPTPRTSFGQLASFVVRPQKRTVPNQRYDAFCNFSELRSRNTCFFQ